MKYSLLKLLIVGIINLTVFLFLFFSFQHYTIYNHSLGLISKNYERTGDWNNPEIKKISKPYLKISNENLETWDASIYKCIKENMYTNTGCYSNVSGAFFPLFPMTWKLLAVNSIGISIFNYLLFILSIALLMKYLSNLSGLEKFLVYSILITLPSTIIYYIPYTESLFLFIMTIWLIGVIKKKYWISFIVLTLLAMVRPATIFILFALLTVEFIALFNHKSFKQFVKKFFSKLLPFVIGFFFSFLIQFIYSSKWTKFFEAQKYWNSGFHPMNTVTDWSVEGFSLNVFSICFVCLPALIFAAYTLIKSTMLSGDKKNALKDDNHSTYFLSVSSYYFVGIFVFTLLTSGGNLHSLFRFIMASPPFYIAVIILLNSLDFCKVKNAILYLIVPIVFLLLFLLNCAYGGERFDFSFIGLYLSVLIYLFLWLRPNLKISTQIIIAGGIILLNIIWNTYMLNMFFCNGWVFT
jgi:hypothetical protein